MKRTKVVIIGGGFGGLYTAKYLRSYIARGLVEVTLINPTNYFLFTPLLHEVATGGLSHSSITESIQEILRGTGVSFIEETVKSIDSIKKEVSTNTSIIPYDYLVVSSGAETNYYGIPGAQENSFVLKNLDDALSLRKQLITMCEKASLITDDVEKSRILSCIVIGAGATGVELVTEIAEFMHETLCAYYEMCGFDKSHMKISLVSAGPDILSQFPVPMRTIALNELIRKGIRVILNEQVTSVSEGKVTFKDGSFIEGGTVVWVAGVKPSTLDIASIEKEKNGRYKIDEYLRATRDIFALGDASGVAPMLAQVAVQQSKIVAKNIIASITNSQLSPFIFRQKGLLASLGQWYAVGHFFGLTFKGPFMWWLWRTIYLFNFHSWRKRLIIAVEWTINIFSPRDISR